MTTFTSLAETRPTPRHRQPFSWGRLAVHLTLLLVGVACVIPMILVISISLSDERQVAREGYSLWPVGFTTFAYEYVLQQPGQILRAYGVTLLLKWLCKNS